MSAPRNTGHRSRSSGAWLGLAALLCLPLLEAAHPFLYYANHARRGYGRNIQPLPCATKEGDTGVCMFAWDCMKAEGTHLGTCIERFYFGSCCKLKPGSKKPEHTVMKTDVYVLATTSQPQTGATDSLTSSTQQTGSTLLGMITGQTTSFDTSTLRTTLLTSGVAEESFNGVQEVQQVFGLGAQETEAQSTSSADLDMEAIEQQMVEESDGQETKEENNEIQTDSDSLPENGDKSQVNEEGTQVPGDKPTGGQTPEVPESDLTTVELSLNETTQHQTDAPIQSTVEEGLSATEESQVSSNQSGDQSDKNEETNDEELDGTPINQGQNEIDGEQESAVVDEASSGQDQSLQFSDTDQNSIDITPEILSQVLEIENGASQDSESQGIGVGVGTVTSVEIDYLSSATEPTVVQSENLPGEAVLENAVDSEHAEDENSDSSIVTPVIQETTPSQTSGPDSTRESSSSENEAEGVESPMESSTAADSSTSTTSVEEQAVLSEVTESSNQAIDTEESETAPTTETVSLTTGENDAPGISSEQTESETTTGEKTSETETTAAAVTEKPSSPAETDEMASQPLGSSDISSEVSDNDSQTTVAPQQIDSTVLPESSDSESPSDSVSIGGEDTSSGIESGQSTSTIEGLSSDSAIKSSSDEASATTSEGESAQGVSDDDDALAAVTEAMSDEASSSSGGDTGDAEGSLDVVSAADESGAASDFESEAQATSDVGDGSDVSASIADSGASTVTTDGSDMQTPDSDISQSVSSTEQAIESDENAPEENDPTNAENVVTDTPTDSLEQDISTSMPSLDENVIVPGVQIVPAPGSVRNESSTTNSPIENVGVDISSGGSADSTTEIPQENISTEAPLTVSSSGEVSSTDKSPAEDVVDPLSSSDEVSVPEKPEVVDGIGTAHLNETTQPEQQFETQEEQLLHRLKTSPFKEICGQPVYPSRRIVGGSQASFGEWPWQVSLRQWRSVTYLHKCGAALVNENWAITAAHCVENVLPDQLLLRLGEFDLERADEPYGHVERKVQIIATHPQFDPRTFEYDLALLRFNEPVTFQPNIIPICIPEDDYDFIGDTGFVSGWGRLYEDGPLPSLMQKVPVPVITNGECEIMYRNAGYIEDIPNIFICAGYEGGKRDSCEGDSGGPLVIQYKNSWKLAGVISWGIGCALPNQPGVYTRISAFREWINKIIVF